MRLSEIITEATRCWDGYKREGTKLKSGRRVPNCVKESNDVGYDNWEHSEPVSYARYLEKTFGAPDELTHKRAIWYNKDGFKRIEVLDEYILHSSPAPHYDYVYSYVDIKVPHDLADDLAKSSESILIDHLKGEVGGRCASLSANAVTIQYVIDVVEGNVKPSKQEYEKRIKSMKKMFADGKRFELDWWPDITGDTDPNNPYYKESINENLRDWFGKGKAGGAGGGGWDRYNSKGERIGKCGDRKPGEGKPKCLSKSAAAKLRNADRNNDGKKDGAAGIARAVRRKKSSDPNPERRGAAKNVKN